MILIAVNDQFYNDSTGTHLTPVSNASVTITLPSWLASSPTAFEVTSSGITMWERRSAEPVVGVSGQPERDPHRSSSLPTRALQSTIASRYLTNVRPGFARSHRAIVWHRTRHPRSRCSPALPRCRRESGLLRVLGAGTGPFTYPVAKKQRQSEQRQRHLRRNMPGLQFAPVTPVPPEATAAW